MADEDVRPGDAEHESASTGIGEQNADAGKEKAADDRVKDKAATAAGDTNVKGLASHRRAIGGYAFLFLVWILARAGPDLLTAAWPPAASWGSAAEIGAAESLLPPSIRIAPSDSILVSMPGPIALDSAVRAQVPLADTLVISRNALLAADTGLRAHMSAAADTLLAERLRAGILDDLGLLVALIVALTVVAVLARSALKQPSEQWVAVAIHVLIAVLVVLGIEVVRWLVSQPPDPGLVNVFKGVALASAMGGITYTLINIAAKWRQAYGRVVGVSRRQQAYLVAKRRVYEEHLQELWKKAVGNTTHVAERAARIKRLEQELDDINEELQRLIRKEMNETDEELKKGYHQVFLDLRVVHVVMSMLLALGLIMLALALGIDFFAGIPGAERGSEQYAAAILGLAFLVGMFPRVFERFLKGVADRLIGARENRRAAHSASDGAFDLTPEVEPPAGDAVEDHEGQP